MWWWVCTHAWRIFPLSCADTIVFTFSSSLFFMFFAWNLFACTLSTYHDLITASSPTFIELWHIQLWWCKDIKARCTHGLAVQRRYYLSFSGFTYRCGYDVDILESLHHDLLSIFTCLEVHATFFLEAFWYLILCYFQCI